MLALLLLTAATFTGVCLALRLRLGRGAWAQLAIGSAVAQLLVLFVPFYFAYSFDCGAARAGQLATGLLVVLALAGGFALRRALGSWLRALASGLRAPEHRPLVATGAAWLALFAWLHHTHYLRPLPDGLHSAGVTWGDLVLHAGLASRFLKAEGLPVLEHPLFLHGPLIYPFLPDYSVAVLAALGLGLRGAFIAGGMYGLASLLLAMHALVRAWLPSLRGALPTILTWLLFLLAGGFGFVFSAQRLLDGTPLLQLLANTNATYDIAPHIAKAGHIGNLFLASRCASYGMPIAISALLVFAPVLAPASPEAPPPARSALLTAGVLAGALPLVHTHSFLVLGGWLLVQTSLSLPRLGLTAAASCFAPLALLSAPQLWFLSRGGEWSFLRWAPGFLRPAPSALDWALDLLLGMGLAWLLLPWALRRARPGLVRATWPLLVLLPIANLVAFAPAPYDNIKLVAWFDLALAILLAGWLAPLLRAAGTAVSAGQRAFALLALLLCTLSGTLALGHELVNDALAVSTDDVRFAQLVEQHTPADAVIATAASWHDPIVMLTGRRTLMAAPYMVRLNGLDVRARATAIAQLYAGGPVAEALIERYDLFAVVIGPAERSDLPRLDEAFFAARARARHELAGRRLYVLDRQRAR